MKQGVALTGGNRTGPPWRVGRLTAHAPDWPASSVTDDDYRRRQTPASVTSLACVGVPVIGLCNGQSEI